jgi:ferredoxin
MISRQFGSGVRLAGVTTDMPLVATAPDRFGGDEFCKTCQVCTRACPPSAIADQKQMVRGVERWYVDFDKMHPLLCRGGRVCYLHCRLPVDAARCEAEVTRHHGAAACGNAGRGLMGRSSSITLTGVPRRAFRCSPAALRKPAVPAQ